MAKPLYFYGIHATQAIISHRPMDAVALFIQSGREQDSGIKAMISEAEAYGIHSQLCAKDTLTKLAGSPQHQGIVLQARPAAVLTEDRLTAVTQKSDVLLLVLDQITDPNNLGACLRTAVAMGVDAVIVPKHHSSTITPAVAKVAVGAVELIPFIQVTNLARTLKQLQDQGVFVFGTALDTTAKPAHSCDFTGKVAIIMGSEGEGMRRLTSEMCDHLVYIPMSGNPQGGIQSLNVSVATGIMLYEVSRQRQ